MSDPVLTLTCPVHNCRWLHKEKTIKYRVAGAQRPVDEAHAVAMNEYHKHWGLSHKAIPRPITEFSKEPIDE